MAVVIVVDDEPDIADSVAGLLECGFPSLRVEATTSTAAALRLMRDGADLLLTDFRMPGMNGIELALRALAVDPALPVLLMTAFPDDDRLDGQAASAGIRRVIRKPLDPKGVLEAVETELAGLAA